MHKYYKYYGNGQTTKPTTGGEGMDDRQYKEFLIQNILEWQTREQFSKEDLENKSIRTLERIHDNVD